jgi:hypothetical protein
MARASINAPKGSKAGVVRCLQANGLDVDKWGVTIPCTAPREVKDVVNHYVRKGVLQFGKNFHRSASDVGRLYLPLARVVALAPERILRRAETASSYDAGARWGSYFIAPDAARQELLRRGLLPEGMTLGSSALEATLGEIGPAGEQALADEARYFETWNDRPSSQRVNCAQIDTIDVTADGSAALITRHIFTLYRSALRSSTVECYLVVRDATTGERHVLSVPPKFGSRKSVTRRKLLAEGGPAAVIHAATAWTFGIKPADYHPTTEA